MQARPRGTGTRAKGSPIRLDIGDAGCDTDLSWQFRNKIKEGGSGGSFKVAKYLWSEIQK